MQHYATLFSIGLTPRQNLALPHIACASSIAEGAKNAQIDRTTLHRWMRDAHFRAELQRMRDDVAEIAKAKLQGLMLKSVIVLGEIIDDPDPSVRLRVARTALNAALRMNEDSDLRHRIEVLDEAIAMLKRQI